MSQRPRQLKLPIPTTIITGHLGCGKTTAIFSLIARKPADEHWCVIVNEFGAVGIDELTLNAAAAATTTTPSAAAAAGSVTVKQIAGGCMVLCASRWVLWLGMLLPAVAQIIRTVRPDRLLIEPSGLGHPGGLLDVLQGPHLASALQLNAIVCLVDLSCFDPQQLATNPTAMDQVTVADVLVGSKADATPAGAVAAFQQWAQDELFPCKIQVLVAAQGQVPLGCLDAARSAGAALMQRLSSGSSSSSRGRQQQLMRQAGQGGPPVPALPAEPDAGGASSSTPQPRRPARVTNDHHQQQQQQQFVSCGWVFHEADRFAAEPLLQLLTALQPAVACIKGVLRVADKQWVAPAAAGACRPGEAAASAGQSPGDAPAQQQLVLQPVCYRGPSVVEVICEGRAPAWRQRLSQAVAAYCERATAAAGDEDVWASVVERALLACLQ